MAEGDLSKRTITVPSIINDFSDDVLNSEYHAKSDYANAINKYGTIYRILNFSEIDVEADLISFTKEWIRRNYYDGVISFTVKAVDLHLLGYDVDKILCGDRIPVEFVDETPEPVTRTLTCMSAQYDLLKPEASSYTIGIPDVSSNVKYRKSVTKPMSNSGGSGKNTKSGDEKKGVIDTIVDVLSDFGITYGPTGQDYWSG